MAMTNGQTLRSACGLPRERKYCEIRKQTLCRTAIGNCEMATNEAGGNERSFHLTFPIWCLAHDQHGPFRDILPALQMCKSLFQTHCMRYMSAERRRDDKGILTAAGLVTTEARKGRKDAGRNRGGSRAAVHWLRVDG